MLTPGDVHGLLDRHGLSPSKRLGQHFVIDHNTLWRMVRDAGVRAGDHVCEVGPGLGSLTVALREAGARVTAVEIDSGMVRALHEVVDGDPSVRVVHGDVRAVDVVSLIPAPAVVVANLPYAIATSVTLDLLALEHFDRLHVMVQREVGRRWAAAVGDADFGATSVKTAAYADARVVARVSRRAFYPVPGVDSVTVTLTPRPWASAADRDAVLALVDQGYAQRRKRLRNALGRHIGAQTADAAIAAIGQRPDVRAEQLDLPAWCDLEIALRDVRFPSETSPT